MSAKSFTVGLPGPSVKVMVVVHRLIAGRGRHAPDQRVGGIAAERKRRVRLGAPEISVDRLADEKGHGHPAPFGLVSKFAERGFGKAKVCRHEPSHGDMTRSPYREYVKRTGREGLSTERKIVPSEARR